MGYFYLVAGII